MTSESLAGGSVCLKCAFAEPKSAASFNVDDGAFYLTRVGATNCIHHALSN